MNWKFWEHGVELETREDSLTTALIDRIVERAGGSTARPSEGGALMVGSGLVGRAFASATVTGARPSITRALTPDVLERIGRELLRTGECLFYFRVGRDGLRLFPVVSYDVVGTYDPATWRYRLDLSGPSGTWSVNARPDNVVHVRYMVEAERPWKGVAPLDVARSAGRLNSEVNTALHDEASGPRGSVIPVPKEGNDATLATLKSQLAGLMGKAALIETTSAGWGQGQGQAPRGDWVQKRIGSQMPDALVSLRNDSDRLVLGLLGIPIGMLEKVDGAAMRESWRQLLHALVAPLGKIVETELRGKLDSPSLAFSWSELRASDIAGRARAFNSLVQGGMEIDKALAVTGLLAQEEG